MKLTTATGLNVLAVVAMLMLAGCGHRLVASPGEHTVAIYPDKSSLQEIEKMKSDGGAVGMLGGIGQNIVAKKVDDRTPVKVLSTSPDAVEVEVTGGPDKGVRGFVEKKNLN